MVLLDDPLQAAIWKVWRWCRQSEAVADARCASYCESLHRRVGSSPAQPHRRATKQRFRFDTFRSTVLECLDSLPGQVQLHRLEKVQLVFDTYNAIGPTGEPTSPRQAVPAVAEPQAEEPARPQQRVHSARVTTPLLISAPVGLQLPQRGYSASPHLRFPGSGSAVPIPPPSSLQVGASASSLGSVLAPAPASGQARSHRRPAGPAPHTELASPWQGGHARSAGPPPPRQLSTTSDDVSGRDGVLPTPEADRAFTPRGSPRPKPPKPPPPPEAADGTAPPRPPSTRRDLSKRQLRGSKRAMELAEAAALEAAVRAMLAPPPIIGGPFRGAFRGAPPEGPSLKTPGGAAGRRPATDAGVAPWPRPPLRAPASPAVPTPATVSVGVGVPAAARAATAVPSPRLPLPGVYSFCAATPSAPPRPSPRDYAPTPRGLQRRTAATDDQAVWREFSVAGRPTTADPQTFAAAADCTYVAACSPRPAAAAARQYRPAELAAGAGRPLSALVASPPQRRGFAAQSTKHSPRRAPPSRAGDEPREEPGEELARRYLPAPAAEPEPDALADFLATKVKLPAGYVLGEEQPELGGEELGVQELTSRFVDTLDKF